MVNWLPDNFKKNEIDAAASHAFDLVTMRAATRRKRVRALRFSALPIAVLAAVLLVLPGLVRKGISRQDSVSTALNARRDAATPAEILRESAAAQTVTLTKVDHSVALTWKGNPGEKYKVFRCSSPEFDRCSLAGVVKGDRWVDVDDGGAKVVYYKVVGCEPKKGGAVGSASSRFS